MNFEVDGSVQGQTSGNRVPPRSTGPGAPGLSPFSGGRCGCYIRWLLAPRSEPEAAYHLCSPGLPGPALPPQAPGKAARPLLTILGPGQVGRDSPPLGIFEVKQWVTETVGSPGLWASVCPALKWGYLASF